MNLLLHTIALEPARWTQQRVTTPLAELLPRIAGAGFADLEIFEPHLALAPDESALAEQFTACGLRPVMLSSYLDTSPAFNPETTFATQADALLARVDRFGFHKVRLFAGRSPSPEMIDTTVHQISERIRRLADARRQVEFLLETHDGSLADDPVCMVRLVEACGCPNVGLLWQPTVFAPAAALAQLEVQKPLIRHFHLQNRKPDVSFTTLEKGVVPWVDVLREVNFRLDATLEFVPSGICPPEQFDLDASLREAAAEFAYIAKLTA